jgi:lysozyme family protein
MNLGFTWNVANTTTLAYLEPRYIGILSNYQVKWWKTGVTNPKLWLFATHYKTGEMIPICEKKIKESASFQEGLATMRQLSFDY